MANPTTVTVPDDTQSKFSRMQASLALDLRALFEQEQDEIDGIVKKAAAEGWSVERMFAEIDSVGRF